MEECIDGWSGEEDLIEALSDLLIGYGCAEEEEEAAELCRAIAGILGQKGAHLAGVGHGLINADVSCHSAALSLVSLSLSASLISSQPLNRLQSTGLIPDGD